MSDAAGTARLNSLGDGLAAKVDARLAQADQADAASLSDSPSARQMWHLLNGMASAKHAVLRGAHEELHRIGNDTHQRVEADVHVAAGHAGPMTLCREQTCGYAWAAIDQLREAAERLR